MSKTYRRDANDNTSSERGQYSKVNRKLSRKLRNQRNGKRNIAYITRAENGSLRGVDA